MRLRLVGHHAREPVPATASNVLPAREPLRLDGLLVFARVDALREQRVRFLTLLARVLQGDKRIAKLVG